MSTVTVRFWAGAQRAAGREQDRIDAATIAELRAVLAARDGFERLSAVASFLVDEVPAGDTTALREGAVVDVLPPFAGGAGSVSR